MVDVRLDNIRDKVSAAIRVHQSVGVQLPENLHNDLLESMFNSMCSNSHDSWTFVTVSKPFDFLSRTYKDISQSNNIRFIDCISRAAGISSSSNNCIYIDSPVMLERLILEILNSFKGVKHDGDKFVIIDSLSALLIYNDPEIVREFSALLMNRGRTENIHIISLLVEEETTSNKLIQLNDKIIVLRDSFLS
jgi:hypothetical protein